MDRKLLPVDGYPDLALDPATNMILNINTSKAERNKLIRHEKMKHDAEFENLKSDVQQIKAMLQKLLENGTNG